MSEADLLVDSFGRVREIVHEVLHGLSAKQLSYRPDGRGNSIGWLVWHLTRVQDDHVADAAGKAQVWTEQGWADRFDLPFDRAATGYGHSGADVDAVRISSPDLLGGYHDAVHAATIDFLHGLTADDYATVVDDAWDPPVTLAIRLVSVVSDDLQHAGQAAYVRGLLP